MFSKNEYSHEGYNLGEYYRGHRPSVDKFLTKYFKYSQIYKKKWVKKKITDYSPFSRIFSKKSPKRLSP